LTHELFHDRPDSTRVTNRQLLLALLGACLVAGTIMAGTRTTAHSAQTWVALLLFYSACLLPFGLRPQFEGERWAGIGVRYVPLLLLSCGVAWGLLRRAGRHYQAPPWVYGAAFLLVAIAHAVSLSGLREWTAWEDPVRQASSYLLLAGAGAVQVGLGLWARSSLRHRCRLATWIVVFVGLVDALAGLALAGEQGTWPEGWWSPVVFGQEVPATHLALPLVSLAITLLACRFQMFAFLLVGLLGFAGSIHLLGYLYFDATASWPRLMIAGGAVGVVMALYLELRRTRGHEGDDLTRQHRL
jgi:hypothetical protein